MSLSPHLPKKEAKAPLGLKENRRRGRAQGKITANRWVTLQGPSTYSPRQLPKAGAVAPQVVNAKPNKGCSEKLNDLLKVTTQVGK